MTITNFIRQMRLATRIFDAKDRRKYWSSVLIQSCMTVFDLIGVVLLGIVGLLAAKGVQSQPLGGEFRNLLEFARIENFSIQQQVGFISAVAILILTFKTFFTIAYSRKILFFLGSRGSQLSASIMSRTLSKGYQELKNRSQIELQYAMGDGVTAISLGVLGIGLSVIADLTLLLVISSGVFIMDPFTAVITFGLFALIALALHYSLSEKAKSIGQIIAKNNVASNKKIIELIAAYREIYLTSRLGFYVAEIASLKKEQANQSARQTFLPFLSKYVIELAVTLTSLIVAATLFATREAPAAAASLALFIAAASRIAPALLRIQQGVVQIQANIGLAQPTIQLLGELESVPELDFVTKSIDLSHHGFEGTIELKSVTFGHNEDKESTLSEISLSINNGEFVAIVGPTGSGKSTLVDLMLGILEPQKGTVLISGKSPDEVVKKWPGAIGYVPQYVNVFNGNLLQNLQLGYPDGSFSQEDLGRTLEMVHLQRSEIDWTMPLGDLGTKLSGGQRQRLGIARALLLNPKILVLDEATSSLDSQTENQISRMLLDLKGKITIIVVAHRLPTVASADRLIYLKNGVVEGAETFEKLRKLVPDFDKQALLFGL